MKKEIMNDVITKCVCKQCNHVWWPRIPNSEIKRCSRCKSTLWNSEKTDKKGYRAGQNKSVWVDRDKQSKEKDE